MAEILYDEIPSLDLADFTSGDESRKSQFVKDLGDAYSNIGFVAIRNHGLSDELTSNLYSSVKSFFDLPEERKKNTRTKKLRGNEDTLAKEKSTPKEGRQVI